jgi:hypothetical protein
MQTASFPEFRPVPESGGNGTILHPESHPASQETGRRTCRIKLRRKLTLR